MGSAQSTSQRIEQIVENYAEVNAVSTARNRCQQKITMDMRGSLVMNCNGPQLDQQCSAMSNANLDTVVKALQSATLDSEAKQKAEGIAMAMNVSVTDHEMVTKTLNKLVAKCKSNADNVMNNVNHFDFRDMIFDCTDNPTANVLHVTQYGDAEASCVVKQIIDVEQDNTSRATTDQENIGLKLPDFGALIGVILLVLLVPMFMPQNQKNSDENKYP